MKDLTRLGELPKLAFLTLSGIRVGDIRPLRNYVNLRYLSTRLRLSLT